MKKKDNPRQASLIERNTTFLVPLLMLIVDYCAILCAEEAAFLTRQHTFWAPGRFHISWINYLVTIPVIYILFLQVEQLYKRRTQFWQMIPKIFHGCNYAIIAIIILMYAAHVSAMTSRLFVGFLWLWAFFLVTSFRYISGKFIEKIETLQLPVLIVGSGEKAAQLSKAILHDAGMGYKIIGLVADEYPENPVLQDYEVLGKIEDVEQVIRTTGVRNVVLAVEDMSTASFKDLVSKVQYLVKNVLIVPEISGIPMQNIEVESLFAEKVMLLKIKNNLARPFNILLKNMFDYVATVLGTILISPVLVAIALWIYKDNPGPVIFKHTRICKGGKRFSCYKFRTMVTNSQEVLEQILATDPEAKKEWEENFKLKHDPRVTRSGAFLRKTSLDELPQILNVLRGEMSLVGPRPVVEKELELYGSLVRDYLSVKPGITGYWQVNGRSDTTYEERVLMDSWYVQNWSIWLDMMILWRTVKAVIKHKGAY